MKHLAFLKTSGVIIEVGVDGEEEICGVDGVVVEDEAVVATTEKVVYMVCIFSSIIKISSNARFFLSLVYLRSSLLINNPYYLCAILFYLYRIQRPANLRVCPYCLRMSTELNKLFPIFSKSEI